MIISTNIPQGYKSSPLGIIPKDWEVKRLGEIGIFVKGYGVPKDHIKKDGYPCLTYGDLYTKYDVVIKNIQSFIDDEDAATSQKIYDGDILFAGSGETPEDIGKCAAYIDKQVAYAGGDIIILRPTMPYNNLVLSYILNSDIGGKQRYQMAQGHSVVHIYPCNLEKISIPLPPLAEQERIAELLGTWDRAIEMQKQLIEKLELRKKGLMQQLLTGKKRLPGFTGEWKKVRLGGVCTISTGKLDANAMVDNGAYMFFTCSKENYLTDTYAFDGEALLISGNGEVGIVKYFNGKFNAYQRTYVLQNFKLDVHFLKLYIEHFLPQRVLREKNVGAMPYIILSTLSGMSISHPSIEEQLRIASFIENNEIEQTAATQKLASLQDQKKGLMQVLLTGKKRI